MVFYVTEMCPFKYNKIFRASLGKLLGNSSLDIVSSVSVSLYCHVPY